MNQRMLSVQEVADAWNVVPRVIYNHINAGKLKAFRVAGQGKYLIPESELVDALKPVPIKRLVDKELKRREREAAKEIEADRERRARAKYFQDDETESTPEADQS